jgi:hypothetical protein
LNDEVRVVLPGAEEVTYLGVQPGERYIWVSGGKNTEIYSVAGELIHVLESFSLNKGNFDRDGELFFGIDSTGEISALQLSSFKQLWTEKGAAESEEVLVVETSEY